MYAIVILHTHTYLLLKLRFTTRISTTNRKYVSPAEVPKVN